jgi:outer membrane protein assembly factor BamE
MDVEQGNVITPEKIAQLQLGMTRREARFVLGTPLIKDPFHADRWDYVYSLRDGSTRDFVQQHLSLVFKGDLLVNIRHNLSDFMIDGAN